MAISSRSSIPKWGVDRLVRACAVSGLALWVAGNLSGAEKEPKKIPPIPRLAVVHPLAIVAGPSNLLTLRGSFLTNVTELRFLECPVKPEIILKSPGPATVPKDGDVKKLGDTQIEAVITFPPGTTAITNKFVVISPDGESQARQLIILPRDQLVEEKEPNGGFKQAHALSASGETLQGLIKEAADVDVFRFDGRRGQEVRIEVAASAMDSALDSLVYLHDATGRILATSDDQKESSDSLIRHKLPDRGTYFVTVIDAHDKGGPGHNYLLRVTLK